MHAKAEVRQTVNKAGQAAGMYAGAAVAAFLSRSERNDANIGRRFRVRLPHSEGE